MWSGRGFEAEVERSPGRGSNLGIHRHFTCGVWAGWGAGGHMCQPWRAWGPRAHPSMAGGGCGPSGWVWLQLRGLPPAPLDTVLRVVDGLRAGEDSVSRGTAGVSQTGWGSAPPFP